jgi:hypothetical protein
MWKCSVMRLSGCPLAYTYYKLYSGVIHVNANMSVKVVSLIQHKDLCSCNIVFLVCFPKVQFPPFPINLQVFMAVNIKSTIFWGVTLCSFVAGCQCCMTPFTKLHSVTSQKTESLDWSLLTCDAVSLGKWFMTFWRLCSFETLWTSHLMT